MMVYLRGVWAARYFWAHLARSDLRSRWRRSYLGIFWSLLQPLGTTLLLAYVFSHLFHTDITQLAVHILSGMIVWEFIMATSVGGALSFVQADAYIKQYRHPLAIYSLRTVLVAMAVLLLASLPLYAWALIALPHNFGLPWLAVVTIYPILALIAWPLATLLAYIGARFRDLQYALGLGMQALWFMSPVYFEPRMFRDGGLGALVDYNPIYHLLQLARAPLIQGRWPSWDDYLYSLGLALLFTLIAVLVGRKAEAGVIFHL